MQRPAPHRARCTQSSPGSGQGRELTLTGAAPLPPLPYTGTPCRDPCLIAISLDSNDPARTTGGRKGYYSVEPQGGHDLDTHVVGEARNKLARPGLFCSGKQGTATPRGTALGALLWCPNLPLMKVPGSTRSSDACPVPCMHELLSAFFHAGGLGRVCGKPN